MQHRNDDAYGKNESTKINMGYYLNKKKTLDVKAVLVAAEEVVWCVVSIGFCWERFSFKTIIISLLEK